MTIEAVPTSRAPDSGDTVVAARAAARFSKALEVALAEIGLSLPQYRLLLFLSGGPERASALAGQLDVSPPSLTALVDGCVARGLVERTPSAEDRRRVVHVITDEGDRALVDADRVVAARLEQFLDHVGPAQRRKVVEGLEILWRAMDSAREARRVQEAAR